MEQNSDYQASMVKDAQKLCPASQMKVITERQRRSELDIEEGKRQIARTPFPRTFEET